MVRFVTEVVKGRQLITPVQWADVSTASLPISDISPIDVPPLDDAFPYSPELQAQCAGREWLLTDLDVSLETLHDHYLHGYLTYQPGIRKHQQTYTCERCGNHLQRLFATFSCARCGESCVYCRHCITMGRVSACTPLIRWCGPEESRSASADFVMDWTGQLSSAQSQASERVCAALGQAETLLIWAVCGAGKTEVMYPGIEQAIRQGLRVCWASPRADVILELAPRFAAAFSQCEQVALYGGSPDRGRAAPLTLATTHQLMRFKAYFDVVIVDEVDAFPFSMDESLVYAVDKAKKTTATTMYLTATPSAALKADIAKQRLSYVRIPQRFHGYPLPVPHFHWCGHWEKALRKKRLPKVIKTWAVHQLEKGRQAFLFVPSVAVMEVVVDQLQQIDDCITAAHAGDDERQAKVKDFRDGRIPIMVTTTILERGVTIPGVEVAVLGADHDIFTEAALVQMAGRVGRDVQQPDGDVRFFHYGKTEAMIAAKRHIEGMNREAFG